MKNKLLILALLNLFSYSYSQVGFLNKNNQISIIGIGNVPYLSGSFKNEEYRIKNTQLNKSTDWLDFGGSISYIHYNSFRFGLGLMLQSKLIDVEMPQDYQVSLMSGKKVSHVNSWQLRIESLKYSNHFIGPKFEFKTREGLNGVGLNFDLSTGLLISRLMNKSYAYALKMNQDTNPNADWSEIDYFNVDLAWKNFYGIYLQSGMNMKVPLNSSFIFSYGVNYVFAYMIKPSEFNEINNDLQIFNYSDVFYKIQRENLAAFHLNFGINYCF